MKKRKFFMRNYRFYFIIAMVLIALGITIKTGSEGTGSLGLVLIAVGGLFFISAMNRKRIEDNTKTP